MRLWVLLLLAFSLPAQRPNFVFFLTDDISPDDLGCYGHPTIRTPHIDAIAREGLVFDQAYLTTSSCSPSRCSIITGRYPHNTGAPELHTRLPQDQVTFPELMRRAGYYTLLSGKNHMGDVDRAFEVIDKGRGPGKERGWVDLLRDRPTDRPFFFWLASTDAHRGWRENDRAPRYDPDDMAVPPFLVDGPVTRSDLAGYAHEVSRTDHYVGQLVAELKRQEIAGHTYLVYCSDNGRPFPRCKTRLYDSGIKTPLIFWSPGRITRGRTASLASAIDLSATFLDLAGIERPETVQGTSLAPILRNPAASVRTYAFAERNWHVYQSHERMLRTGRWMYIRNAWPERQALCKESDPTFPAGRELWERHAAGNLSRAQSDIFSRPRSSDEMYDVGADPHQLRNLATDPRYAKTRERLRRVLDEWASETGDTVPENPTPDREDIHGTKNAGFKRGTFPGQARSATTINHPGPVR